MLCHGLISSSETPPGVATLCETGWNLDSISFSIDLENQRGLILSLPLLKALCLLNAPSAAERFKNMEFFVLQLTEKGHVMVMGCFDGTHLQT